MSDRFSSRRKSEKNNSNKPKDGQRGPRKGSSSFSRGKGSSSSAGSHSRPAAGKGGRGGGGGGKRPMPTFDPSLFMQKVEERVAAQPYTAKHTFADFALVEQLKTNIANKGYVAPTPIQDQAIPHLLEGQDVVGTANTGTGKTAAFLIPLINNVLTQKSSRVLIIAPTRELAGQIQDEFKSFAVRTGLTSTLCIGGVSLFGQTKALKNDPVFVIGTPGRLIDLENSGTINFGRYNAIVLDEVDRMLDMGFIRDIKQIIDKLPKKRHSLFFSATLSKELQPLVASFLKNPIAVSVKTRQSSENINQEVIKVGSQNKLELLHDLLIKPAFKKVLIFVRTKHAVDKLARELTARGFKVALIHGNRSQAQRNRALHLFKTDQATILLATDVVARGIDIDDISHVINFDLPQTHEDYIHRIGRTGRADKVGQAITFI